jgi:hypothetical protein
MVLAVACAAADAAAGTKFVSTWRAPDVQPGRLAGQKVVSVLVSDDEGLRRGIEHILARELTKLGVQGVPLYSIVPASQVRDEAKVRAHLEKEGVAGAVVMRILSRSLETSGETTAMYYSAPSYNSFYDGGYWGYGWGGVFDAGHVLTEHVFNVETLVYSLGQNKLAWAAHTRTTDPKDARTFMADLVGRVAKEMKKEGLLR